MKRWFFLVLLVLVACLGLTACANNTQAYQDAEALMQAGDYQAAEAAFTALGSYQDAAAKAETCGLYLLRVHDLILSEDQISISVSFDRAYSELTGLVHADVDNETFVGTAESEFSVGNVQSGQLYTYDIPLNQGFTYSGQFTSISLVNGGFNIKPPNMTGEDYTVSIKDGETILLSQDSASE